MIKSVEASRVYVAQARLLLVSLLAVVVFALVVSFVSAREWRIDADFKQLAAIGGTMVNVVTGAIVYAAVRLRSRVLDEDLAADVPQDGAGSGEDRRDDREV